MNNDTDDNAIVFTAISMLVEQGQASFNQLLLDNLDEVNSNITEFLIIAVELAIDEGRYDTGMTIINTLLTLAKRFTFEPDNSQGMCYLSRSDIYTAHAQHSAAVEDIKLAMPLFEQAGDYYNLAECYSQLAGALESEPQQAIHLLNNANQTLRGLRKTQPISANAFVQNYSLLASIYYDQGALRKAQKYYSIGLQIVEKYPVQTAIEISLWNNYACFLTGLNDYAKAQKVFSDIYPRAEELGLTDICFSCAHNQADIALILENFDKGLQLGLSALDIAIAMDNELEIARSFILLGLLENGIAKKQGISLRFALRYLNQARKLLLNLEESHLLGEVYLNIGIIIQSLNPKRTMDYYQQALPLLNSYLQKSALQASIAELHTDAEEYDLAMACFIEARKMLDNNAWREKADLYISVARFYYEQYQSHKAVVYYQKALVSYRKITNTLHDNKGSFIAAKTHFFRDAIAVALEAGNYTAAFDFIEMSKSQRLLDILNKPKYLGDSNYEATVMALDKTPNMAQEQKLRQQIADVEQNVSVSLETRFVSFKGLIGSLG